jgi:methylthioribulose-1-phosphate dehydratase
MATLSRTADAQTNIEKRDRPFDCDEASVSNANIPAHVQAMQDIGALFYQRGWSVGTSSNYSVLLSRDPWRQLITASGKDKSNLQPHDFVVVDESGKVVEAALPSGLPLRTDAQASPHSALVAKPSAETLLHVVAAQLPDVGAVLHTHSVWATILSDLYHPQGAIEIEGYEMLKGLEGIRTHEHRQRIEIFENTQDIPKLATAVLERLTDPVRPLRYGFLLRRHGLYTWGRDLDEARRHVEILEFLFEALGRTLMLRGVQHPTP